MSFIGKNIKKIRTTKKLNQAAFAELFDISRSSVGSYEEGRAEPKTDTLVAISNYFSISIDLLITKEITVNDLSGLKKGIHANQIRDRDSQHEHLNFAGNHCPFISLSTSVEYLERNDSTEFVDSLEHLALPLPENINTRGFQVYNENMYLKDNRLHQDDILIGSFVNKKFIKDIPRNQPYIIVFKDQIVFSDLKIQDDNFILQNKFQLMPIPLANVQEVWTFIGFYSTEILNTSDSVSKIFELEDRIKALEAKE